MSYLRRVKKGIPKNSNSCYGCKNKIEKPLYNYEEDTNAYYKDGQYVICKYLNIISSDEDAFELATSIGNLKINEDEFDELLEDSYLAYELHYGNKICGLYKEKIKNNGHFTKSENYIIDDDDIPF